MGSWFKNIFLFVFIMISVGLGVFGEDESAVEAPTPSPTEAPVGEPTAEPAAEPSSPASTNAEELTPPAEPSANDDAAGLWPGPPKVENTTPMEWIEESIKKHNDYRKLHGAGPLVFNKTLAEIAQAYANHIATTFKVEHNPALQSAKLGENLYYSSNSFPTDLDPDKPVTGWYEEIHDYDYTTGFAFDDSKEILHFTQLVWIGTTDVGVAYAKAQRPDGMHAVYVVANYWPRGNFDDFMENVLPSALHSGGMAVDVPAPVDAKPDVEAPPTIGGGGDVAPSGSTSRFFKRGAICTVLFAGFLGVVAYFYAF